MSVLFDRVASLLSPAALLRRGVRMAEAGDLPGAFPVLAKAAGAGLPEAQYRIGKAYLEGAGVPASRPDAALWLERAAESGWVEAQTLLSTLYLYGLIAPSEGSAPGAALFSDGRVATPDYLGAARWSERAAEAGSPEAQALYAYVLT
ncbi:MAG: tetratricopeptide repeat protein, partial [Janthinobacterium lividum]